MANKKTFGEIVTCNDNMIKLLQQVEKILDSNINVVISGENGTGKTILAKTIHEHSNLKDYPLIKISGSQPVETSLNLPLKGTLFLYELGEISLDFQAVILMAIQDKKDVRVIATTTQDIASLVKENKLREDLYFRINEIAFKIPPLKERKEDIPFLINHYIAEFNKEFNKKIDGISQVALDYLLNYEWPGNIRELKNLMRTGVAISDKKQLWLEDIPLKISISGNNVLKHDSTVSVFSLKSAEKEHILRILHMCRWNKSKSAKLLEISRPRLDRKIQEFNLSKPAKKK